MHGMERLLQRCLLILLACSGWTAILVGSAHVVPSPMTVAGLEKRTASTTEGSIGSNRTIKHITCSV